jgi:carboxypeptidase C (cathepsin A)
VTSSRPEAPAPGQSPAQDTSTPAIGTTEPAPGTGTPDAGPAEPADDLVTTRHTLTTAAGELAYTATAGRVVLREERHEDGEFRGFTPRAELFVTSYLLEGADPATRPVIFAFNGGPGSSSTWLHLGLLGPRRVLTGDAGAPAGPPYRLADNAETLLAHADLVFIDPVTTGYSRVVTGGKPADYHGYAKDVESVGEVIRLWTSRHGRWLAPKLLAGESYGTLRAGALAQHLQSRHGLYLAGLILISAVLDIGTLEFGPDNDLPYPLYLPTYAAIAHYHGRHGDRPLLHMIDEARRFAAADYPRALAMGARLEPAERATVVSTLARLTGLSESYVDRAELRPEHLRYFTELLRDRGLVVGRLDGRFTGWNPDGVSETPVDDPSSSAIIGPYSAAVNHYLRAELGYRNDLPYEVLTGRVSPWSYKEFEGRSVSVTAELAQAMRANPHLRLHVACGYFDGATPFAAAEHTLAHLRIPAQLRGNIELRYYPAGHMMYVHEPSRTAQSQHLAEFVRATTG